MNCLKSYQTVPLALTANRKLILVFYIDQIKIFVHRSFGWRVATSSVDCSLPSPGRYLAADEQYCVHCTKSSAVAETGVTCNATMDCPLTSSFKDAISSPRPTVNDNFAHLKLKYSAI